MRGTDGFSFRLIEKHVTASIALPLCSGLASISLAHNWLSTYIAIVHLQQFLLQAVHPSSPQLLQLPHVTPELALQIEETKGINTVKQFGELGVDEVDKVLEGMPEAEKRDVYEVAKHWPIIQFVDAKFQGQQTKLLHLRVLGSRGFSSFLLTSLRYRE